MKEANTRFGFKEARAQIDITNYLASLGHRPKKEMGNDSWYLSPFHQEHTPSFKVDRSNQIWYDHSIGFGGDLVDFVLKYYKCSYSEALQKFKDFLSIQPENSRKKQPIQRTGAAENKQTTNKQTPKKIHIIAEYPIFKYYLKSYLNERCIPFDLAAQYVKEVDFTNDGGEPGKVYTALGFKNNEGGYELRSKNFKASSAPKAPTLITNMIIGETMAEQKSRQSLAVFEGFFSFLSFKELWFLQRIELPMPDNFLILNSLSFFRKNFDMMEQYGERMLFLDADTAGRSATAEALSRSNSYQDYSHLYDGCEDLNKLLVQQERPDRDIGQDHSRRR